MGFFRLNNKGSALVLSLVVGSAAILGSMALVQLSSNYLSQNSQTAKSAQAAGGDLVALDYVRGKFVFGKDLDGKPLPPEWYVDPYPTAEKIAAGQVSPTVLKIPGKVAALKKTDSNPGWVPTWQSLGVKKDGTCNRLLTPQSFEGDNRPESVCDLEDSPVLKFDIDKSNLASVEQQFGTSAFIGRLNISTLDPTALTRYLNGGFITPTKDNIVASPVTFRSFVHDSQYPQALTRMEVQVGNTIASIPIDVPPEPNCQLSLVSSVPSNPNADPGFKSGNSVSFALKTDSILVTAQSSLDNWTTYQDITISSDNLRGQSVSNVGSFRQITTFDLTLPENPLPGNKLSDTTVSWIPQVRVTGVRGTQPKICSLSVPVHKIPPPVCSLAAANPQVLKGQQTVLTLDCTSPEGGPVVSATIANQAVPSSFKTTKNATSNYTRNEIRNSEQITAIVEGPESSITVTTQLGEVCPFNDPNYYQTLLQTSDWDEIKNIVTEEPDKVTQYNNPDPIAFTHNPSNRVVSVANSIVTTESLPENTIVDSSSYFLERNGHEKTANAACRWKLWFNSASGNLMRVDFATVSGQTQLSQSNGPSLNSTHRTSFVVPVPANNILNINSQTSRSYQLLVDPTTGQLKVKETVIYQPQNRTITSKPNKPLVYSAWQNNGDPVTHTQDFWTFGDQKDLSTTNELVLSGTGEVYLKGSTTYHKTLTAGSPSCEELPLTRYYVGQQSDSFNPNNNYSGDIDPAAICQTGRLCMATTQYLATNSAGGDDTYKISNPVYGDGTSLGFPIWASQGGQAYWVEVGPDTDPACKIQRARLRQSGCFKSDTRILMADGLHREISKILENDYVYNPHYQTGVRVKSLVKGPEKKSLYEVLIGKNKVQVTEDHPFFTSRGWLQTLELKKGDVLLGDGEGQEVVQVKKLKYIGPQDVWNFELDTDEPLGHVVVANGLPTGDFTTQIQLKNKRKLIP